MVVGEKIYLDQIAVGEPRTYLADNGEEIVLQIDHISNVSSGFRGESMSCFHIIALFYQLIAHLIVCVHVLASSCLCILE